jgi:probable H4MPT-linked C1 transfer pathway protein
VAAANWHALSRFAVRFLKSQHGLLLDVGSTTTDIIPLSQAGPLECGTTDTKRLADGSLLYTGVTRSPVCAVVQQAPYRGLQLPVAQELFALMHDVYLLRGDLPEDSSNCETADGRPATKAHARARLGRMICADQTEFHHKDAAVMSEAIASAHVELLSAAISRQLAVDEANPTIVLCGKGEFIARRAVQQAVSEAEIKSLRHDLGSAVSAAATAHALAVLASETRGS